MTTPEERARAKIDELLGYAGWEVQDRERMALFGRPLRGVAVREAALQTGFADYLLFVDGRALGVIEAKKEGVPLSGVEAQSARYAAGLKPGMQAWRPEEPLPFRYESTGIETFFTSALDPEPRSRRVFAFHRPETLAAWAAEAETLRGRLRQMPPPTTEGLWPPQIEAIRNLEQSLALDKPRALIQMATGSGKTFTAVNFIYRLIKHADARRVLFLVDRTNLGKQAYNEFAHFQTPEGRKFSELYNIRHLTNNSIDVTRDVHRVYISTVQRLYAMLKDEELEEEGEALSQFEAEEQGALPQEPRTVRFTGKLPVEFFDFIVIDECHRSIYSVWRQVLDYFDASYIGLTATPGKQTVGFFNQNMVMAYGHELAVADGINVAGEVYRIRTRIGEAGSTVEAGYYVGVLDKRTRAERMVLLDEDLVYEGRQLDQDVVSESQIRTILRQYRDALFTELFPGRTIVPKTLIFAKDDNHAENIVRIAREEFGKGNDFCQKITYRSERSAEDILQDFRNSYFPRIAVTVDMIATGTDVKAIEVLLFMRLVRSRGYFEQMRGRATRVIGLDDLQQVTRDAVVKDHFVLVDAVGLTEAELTETTPALNRKRAAKLHELLDDAAYGQADADLVATLAARLARLEQKMGAEDTAVLREAAGGAPLKEITRGLLLALDRDAQEARARETAGVDGAELTEEAVVAAAAALRWEATAVLREHPSLRQALLEIQERRDIVIDIVSEDIVLAAGYDAAATETLRTTVADFRQFIEDNKDEITALQLLYNEPYGARALTLRELKELAETLQRLPQAWTEESLWRAYAALERDRVHGVGEQRVTTDLVALVRHALQPEGELLPYPAQVAARYAAWLAAQEAAGRAFTAKERWWLDKIAAFVGLNLSIGAEDLQADGDFVDRGGMFGAARDLGPAWRQVLDELNEALIA